MGCVIGVTVRSAIVQKNTSICPRAIAKVMQSGPTNTRYLLQPGVLGKVTVPWFLRVVCWAKTEKSEGPVISVYFKMAPLLFGVGPARSCFQQKHIQAFGCQFFRHYWAAATCSNHYDITHLGAVLQSQDKSQN